MPVYRFGVSVGQAGAELFTVAHESFRSDAEHRYPPVAIHDPDSNDLKLARRLADEIINISGAEVKVYARTDNADYDPVWDSDPDPTYWNCVLMKAYFMPAQLEVNLKKWGADALSKTDIFFSYRQVYEQFGERMLRVGDVIQLPYNAATPSLSPINYRIANATPFGNFRYNWLYFKCQTEALTADITIQPDDDVPMPYRESLQD